MFYNEETKGFLYSFNDEFENAKKIEDKDMRNTKISEVRSKLLAFSYQQNHARFLDDICKTCTRRQ